MKKIRLLLCIIGLGLTQFSFSQFVVKGVILDSSTREPLAKASVYCQNTTLGTVTNKDGEFSIELKSGGYDLIFSFTGYQTQTIRVTENTRLEILMTKEDKSMSEVVIKSSNEVPDGWEKYGDFFLANFIGTTPNAALCILENPEVLKFYYYKKSNKLKVLAAEPLLISNMALGYNLRYALDSFVYYYATNINSYRGYCFYTAMEGPDSMMKKWAFNREKAYMGSRLQFMRSYYDSTLIEDGWIIDMLDENSDKKFTKIKDVYDTLYYGALDSTMQVEIFYPRKISITYTKKRPEPEYLKKMNLPRSVPYPISYIDIKGTIAITENGYFYDQKDWVNQGYWSWKNVGDLLPYDYLPD
jgi:hypothetical protein